MFLFSHLTYFVQLLCLGNLSRPKYQQKLNKIMKISQEDVILIKNLYLSSSMVHEGCWGNCPTRVGNFEASTVCWREATKRVQLSCFQAALDRICPVAVKNVLLSQEDKLKRHSLDFAWNCHSLFKCIHKNNSPWSPYSSHASNDVVLSCCLRPIVYPVSLTNKQRYRLQ